MVVKRFLFWLFRSDFVRMTYAGRKPKKSLRMEGLSFAFYDLDGLAYYSVVGDQHPILRKINLAISYTKLVTAISELDISESLLRIYNAVNEVDTKGKMAPNVATIGFICSQLLSRKGRIVVPDYLYDLAANYFIRQDEELEFVNDEILAEKVSALKELPIEVLRDFFFNKELNEIFPHADDPDSLFAEILKEGEIETMAYLKYIKGNSNGAG